MEGREVFKEAVSKMPGGAGGVRGVGGEAGGHRLCYNQATCAS